MWHICPTCFFWGKCRKILHLRAAVASLNNPTAGWMFSTWLEAFALGPQAGPVRMGTRGWFTWNFDGMCEARLSSKMVFPVFILPTILPEKDWEDSRICLFFHHCSSTPKALKPKRVWNLWFSFDTATLHAGSFLLSMGTIKTWKSNFHGKRGHWGHSYSNLIPNLRVFCCRCSYQKSQQLGMPGFPFGDWCLLCGWECCTLCWSHVAGPVCGGVGLCARHIQLCTTCIGWKNGLLIATWNFQLQNCIPSTEAPPVGGFEKLSTDSCPSNSILMWHLLFSKSLYVTPFSIAFSMLLSAAKVGLCLSLHSLLGPSNQGP